MKKVETMLEMVKFAVLASVISIAMPEAAGATASTVNSVLHSVATDQLVGLPYILSVVCYVAGAFMLVSGALSLKKHAEAPTQEPMGKGIARLLTGGAITSVPALTGIIQRSTGVNGASEANYSGFTATFN